MTKRIIQIVLAVVIVCLIYVIYKQISTPIIFAKEKAAREARVIDRIKDIRTAERSFKTKYNRFTGDFDTLINFVLTTVIVWVISAAMTKWVEQPWNRLLNKIWK